MADKPCVRDPAARITQNSGPNDLRTLPLAARSRAREARNRLLSPSTSTGSYCSSQSGTTLTPAVLDRAWPLYCIRHSCPRHLTLLSVSYLDKDRHSSRLGLRLAWQWQSSPAIVGRRTFLGAITSPSAGCANAKAKGNAYCQRSQNGRRCLTGSVMEHRASAFRKGSPVIGVALPDPVGRTNHCHAFFPFVLRMSGSRASQPFLRCSVQRGQE